MMGNINLLQLDDGSWTACNSLTTYKVSIHAPTREAALALYDLVYPICHDRFINCGHPILIYVKEDKQHE